jgi:hypothetical protein
MGLGLFIGSLVVLVIGVLIAGFSWWAGVETGNKPYNDLGCGENIFNRSPELEEKCSAASGGMWVGIGSFIIAAIFIIVGFIASTIFGVKLAVDRRKSKKEKAKIE